MAGADHELGATYLSLSGQAVGMACTARAGSWGWYIQVEPGLATLNFCWWPKLTELLVSSGP